MFICRQKKQIHHLHFSGDIAKIDKLLIFITLAMQGLTIGLRCVHRYTSFYWHSHDFGHAYTDMYAHFFTMIFSNFQNCVLILKIVYCLKTYCYIYDLSFIFISLEITDSLLLIFALKKPYFPTFHTH